MTVDYEVFYILDQSIQVPILEWLLVGLPTKSDPKWVLAYSPLSLKVSCLSLSLPFSCFFSLSIYLSLTFSISSLLSYFLSISFTLLFLDTFISGAKNSLFLVVHFEFKRFLYQFFRWPDFFTFSSIELLFLSHSSFSVFFRFFSPNPSSDSFSSSVHTQIHTHTLEPFRFSSFFCTTSSILAIGIGREKVLSIFCQTFFLSLKSSSQIMHSICLQLSPLSFLSFCHWFTREWNSFIDFVLRNENRKNEESASTERERKEGREKERENSSPKEKKKALNINTCIIHLSLFDRLLQCNKYTILHHHILSRLFSSSLSLPFLLKSFCPICVPVYLS